MISVLRIFFTARGANPWVVLVCLVVASLCEGFGFATLVPLLGAAIQLAVMAGIAFLTWWLGARFGGRGDALGAAKAVVWLNVVMLAFQAAQLVILPIAPPVAAFLAVATLFWLFWAYANFTAELHDFASPFMVLGVAVLTAVGLALALAAIASELGFTPGGAP